MKIQSLRTIIQEIFLLSCNWHSYVNISKPKFKRSRCDGWICKHLSAPHVELPGRYEGNTFLALRVPQTSLCNTVTCRATQGSRIHKSCQGGDVALPHVQKNGILSLQDLQCCSGLQLPIKSTQPVPDPPCCWQAHCQRCCSS